MERELAEMDKALEVALSAKEVRANPDSRASKDYSRAKAGGYAVEQHASYTYQSGGSAAAVESDARRAAEVESIGVIDGGVAMENERVSSELRTVEMTEANYESEDDAKTDGGV